MGDAVSVQDFTGLPDQLFAVRQEYDLAALGDGLRNDRGRRQGLAAAGWQIQHNALCAPGQGNAGSLFSFVLIGAQFKSHDRPRCLCFVQPGRRVHTPKKDHPPLG